MTLAIFLNHKLISCDTILPLAMEVHARSGKPVLFFTTDPKTFDAIRENAVLWDAIHRIGKLVLLGSRSRNPLSRFFNRLRVAVILLPLALKAKFKRANIMHFRALNEAPLSALAYFAADAVFFCEADAYGESQLMRDIVETSVPRVRSSVVPNGSSFVMFSPHWPWRNTDRKLYNFGPTRARKPWVDFSFAAADRYLEPQDKDAIVIMLGYFGGLPYLRDAESTRRLFDQTMDILADEGGGRPILLKPHVFTDLQVVRSKIERIPNARIINIHPSVLATRARVFIANYYSTTLADAFNLGVPTIEFTDYTEKALAVTKGGSMRPEFVSYFISNDAEKFRNAIRDTLSAPLRPIPQGRSDDDTGLIRRLAEG